MGAQRNHAKIVKGVQITRYFHKMGEGHVFMYPVKCGGLLDKSASPRSVKKRHPLHLCVLYICCYYMGAQRNHAKIVKGVKITRYFHKMVLGNLLTVGKD
jgi:hypothetical protein